MNPSFRDPDGYVQDDGSRILRTVSAAAAGSVQSLLASPLYADLIARGLLVEAKQVQPLSNGDLLVEHPRIRLPSYPFEWTQAMLADAALLTLEIQKAAWACGWTLKDAAANNVLFNNGQAVFCDLLSLRPRHSSDKGGWVAYGQFVRNFILPLLAIDKLGRTPRDVFLSSRDGLRASEIAPFLRWHHHLGLAMLLHVWLPSWFEQRRISRPQAVTRATGKESEPQSNAHRGDASTWMIDNLRSLIHKTQHRKVAATSWSNYTKNRDHYGDLELNSKRDAVKTVLRDHSFKRVLDIGANSGEFSRLGVEAGCSVVALDDDLMALNELHCSAKQNDLPIQCLHVNFARPTPSTGWRNAETLPLSERFKGGFDLVLMLAVVHHLAVSERLPLTQIFETVASYCSHSLLIEYVPGDDPRFIEIAGLNLTLYQDWSLSNFITAAAPWFELVNSMPIAGGSERQLLLMRKRD